MMMLNIVDIRRLRLSCNRCTTEVIFPVQSEDCDIEPKKCPGCSMNFLDYSGGNPPEEAKLAAELLMAIQGFQNILAGKADFEIILEMDDDDSVHDSR